MIWQVLSFILSIYQLKHINLSYYFGLQSKKKIIKQRLLMKIQNSNFLSSFPNDCLSQILNHFTIKDFLILELVSKIFKLRITEYCSNPTIHLGKKAEESLLTSQAISFTHRKKLPFLDLIGYQWDYQESIDNVIARIKEFTHLKHLTLHRGIFDSKAMRITDKGISLIQNLTLLQHLDLPYSEITDEGMRTIQKLTQLKYLGLAWASISQMNGIRELTNLSNLCLSACNNLQYIQKNTFKNTTNLKILNLSSTCIEKFHELKYLNNLEILQLSGLKLIDSELEILNKLSKLNSLDVSWCSLDISTLKKIANFTGLTNLNLSSSQIDSFGFEHIQQNLQLKNLSLAGLCINNRMLAAIGKCTNLRYLNLSHSQFDNMQNMLLTLNKMTNLQSIILFPDYTQMDPLEKFSNYPNLAKKIQWGYSK